MSRARRRNARESSRLADGLKAFLEECAYQTALWTGYPLLPIERNSKSIPAADRSDPLLAPPLVDDTLHQNRGVGVEQEKRQHRPPLFRSQKQERASVESLERAPKMGSPSPRSPTSASKRPC